jgi:uracil phosphoribosyltransferase
LLRGNICGISMEDNGMLLLQVFSDISPMSPTGVVSIQARSTGDAEAATHGVHIQPPSISRHRIVLLFDKQCATGDEACDVLDHLVND